jgi:hypothetical protein
MKILIERTSTTSGNPRDREYRTVERGLMEFYLMNGTTDNASKKED